MKLATTEKPKNRKRERKRERELRKYSSNSQKKELLLRFRLVSSYTVRNIE